MSGEDDQPQQIDYHITTQCYIDMQLQALHAEASARTAWGSSGTPTRPKPAKYSTTSQARSIEKGFTTGSAICGQVSLARCWGVYRSARQTAASANLAIGELSHGSNPT